MYISTDFFVINNIVCLKKSKEQPIFLGVASDPTAFEYRQEMENNTVLPR